MKERAAPSVKNEFVEYETKMYSLFKRYGKGHLARLAINEILVDAECLVLRRLLYRKSENER